MTRVKRSVHARKKRRETLERTKGFRGEANSNYKRAKEAVMKADAYAYRDRRNRKRDFRRLWITRINAAARLSGLSYSRLVHGLKLAKGGKLIDTTSGNYELKEVELEVPPTAEALQQLKTPSLDKLEQCLVRGAEMQANPESPLAGEGVEEAGVIVPQTTSDGFQPGPIAGWWPHDFNLRRLTLQTGAYVSFHARKEVEVLFVQSGTIEVGWRNGEQDESLIMGAGDTLSVPVGVQHSFRNTASAPAVLFVVRGTEDPQMPTFASTPTQQFASAAG